MRVQKMKRIYRTKAPSPAAWIEARKVIEYLKSNRNRSRERVYAGLRDMGHLVHWKRVTWTGGVGSFKVLRGGIIRIVAAATCSGIESSTVVDIPIGPGMYDSKIEPGRRRGFRYGYCVEIE